jgi:2-phosphosulfolactate phosphatase
MNSKLDVFSTAMSVGTDDVRNKTVIVIDVLRATTTMATALYNGAKCIVPVENMSDAGQLAARLDPTQYLLCGEKDGKKIEGYNLGNSPFEYTPDAIKDKTLIFNTTNGTRAITRSVTAKRLFLGAMVNVTAVSEAVTADDEVVLVCAGWKNRLSLEDMLCAGMIIDKIYSGNLPAEARDGAKIAFALYEKYKNDIPGVIRSTNHAQRLREFIDPEEIDYCSAIDTLPLVPVFEDGMIIR